MADHKPGIRGERMPPGIRILLGILIVVSGSLSGLLSSGGSGGYHGGSLSGFFRIPGVLMSGTFGFILHLPG